MKTLLLASSDQFITTYPLGTLLPKKISDCKIAYITTASKKVNDISYVERHWFSSNSRTRWEDRSAWWRKWNTTLTKKNKKNTL